MTNGILTVDKDAGMSSHAVVNRLRRLFDQKAVGHGGTLDPMATGVLPMFLGRSTRASGYVQDSGKGYLARVRFGLTTDTLDITGQVLSRSDVKVALAALEAALPAFRGEIRQVPPMYSALQVDGQRLYKLARGGVEVERPARTVRIDRLELCEAPAAFGPREENEFDLAVDCSKGTYIRSLCADLGQALGCGATLSALRRVRAGQFVIEKAYTLARLAELKEEGRLARAVEGSDSLFAALPALHVDAAAETRLRQGATVRLDRDEPGRYRLYGASGEFLGPGEVEITPRGPQLALEKGLFEL